MSKNVIKDLSCIFNDHLPTNNVDKLDSYRHLIANPNQVSDTKPKELSD